MAYPGESPYNNQGTIPPQQHDASLGAQYAQYQGQRPTAHGFPPSSQNLYLANGHVHPRYAPVNASSQHRSPVSSQHVQQTPQRAYVVAIPSPHTTTSASYRSSVNLNSSQQGLAPPPQASARASNGHSSNSIPQQIPAEPPLDYQLLLISLAEEYFTAAYGHGSMASIVHREAEMETYYKLIATGLGCLEALLKRFKLQPEREAVVRLRYATVLYEETENTMEAEEALSKGISICDRHRFFDLKYNMQHLLARMLFEKHSRAAFKFLDGIMRDAEAYQHIAWVYAFRFLKVSLHLEISAHQDLVSALSQLKSIMFMANDYGDKMILAVATTLEALTCLRVSNEAESIEQAQRALARVRSLQLDPNIGEIHQLTVLAAIVDLCCHLQHFDPGQVLSRTHILQTELKNVDESKSWTADGSFPIRIPITRMPSCKTQNGIIRRTEDGILVLMFDWMSRDDIYNLGYLLSGIASAHQNTTNGQKSEHMLEEGIKRLDYIYQDRSKPLLPSSITQTIARQLWRDQTACYMRLHLAFMLCARTSWSAALEQVSAIQDHILSMADSSESTPETLHLLSTYLEAVIYQGTGDLDLALDLYQSDILSIHFYRKTPQPSQLHLDVSLLSALNTLLIIRAPSHPQHDQLPSLLALLEHLCLRNPNRQIQSAYHLLTAATSSSSTILITKQALQSSLQTAKHADNKQLMCMVLNFMSWKFFKGVVGDQAEKAARASQTLAQKCMDSLWISVAAGVLGDTLEAAGRIEEAKRARETGFVTAESLPEWLREVMSRDAMMIDDG